VSQSVELDHPRALDFLREDCLHVTDFFRKNNVAAMSVRELFDFVVEPSLAENQVDEYLEKVQERIMNRAVEPSVEEQVAEAVFIQVCTILFAIGFFICCSCILHLQQWLGVVLIDGQETICKL
jgi:hypothetical protein